MATEYRNNAKLNVVTRRWREHFPTPQARVSDNDGADSDEESWSVYRDVAKDRHDSDPTGEDELLADLYLTCRKMYYDEHGESNLVEHVQQ
jgi:hypothetical protein